MSRTMEDMRRQLAELGWSFPLQPQYLSIYGRNVPIHKVVMTILRDKLQCPFGASAHQVPIKRKLPDHGRNEEKKQRFY